MNRTVGNIKDSIDAKIKEYSGSDAIILIDLGIIRYLDAFKIQEYLFEKVLEKKARGFMVLLEHNPVITIGSNRSTSNLVTDERVLAEKGIELIQSNRGGDITFHGPGQLVGYPILGLSSFKKDLGAYVYDLEEVIIQVLSHFGLKGERIKGLRGVFIGNEKIASIGVRVRKWITMHGFAFNVSVDLTYFENIIACGLKDHSPTSLNKVLGKDIPIDFVKEQIIRKSKKVFDIAML